jgi:uncharacterized RDD family membrane protein YckC
MSNPRFERWKQQMEGSRYGAEEPIEKATITHQIEIKDMQYVGFWRRVFAYLIDSVICLAVMVILMMLLRNNLNFSSYMLILPPFYFIIMPLTQYQGTFGLLAINGKIVDTKGNKISPAQSIGRFITVVLGGSLFGLGLLIVAFHNKKRGLHDLIAGTYVVNRD